MHWTPRRASVGMSDVTGAAPVRCAVRRRDSGIVTMQPGRIFETVLYAEDLAAAERFYHEALGLEVIERGNLVAVFRCGGGVLLIFDPRKSAAPGRDVPAHGTSDLAQRSCGDQRSTE